MRQEALTPPERESLLLLVKGALARQETAQLEARYGMKFFLLPHIRSEAEEAVSWAQDYWLMRREAIPTRAEGKCRSCEFNDVCAYSLAKPQH